ncbi:hypothetical protein IST455A_03663 [Burkholderia multivorans]|uniref:hypothetical protein n=1 Tax=Burkholderia multivorans TaxID=87883 RepID=UPI0006A59133|nr:hypothetical protein [Burkholderia multivorans]KOE24088.1 hypothetical protein AI46_20290 [Burkholderia multivorans R-20526]MBU9208573.1 hypothetical protein [Burkholderia multivorans]MBU9242915.1 hypothetical protein [Burkholderia multivorans]MBU9542230.1 hypothetical protein [Burkholderia multivorans]MCA8172695.1 hypothetical protein [Burkholderia multivorans]
MNTDGWIVALVAAGAIASGAMPACAQSPIRMQGAQLARDAGGVQSMAPIAPMPKANGDTAIGGDAAAASEAGGPSALPSGKRPAACVGPESFCTLYFGS